MKNKIVLSAIALATAGGVLLTAVPAFAQTTTPKQSLIQEIASKFGLNVSDVQSVFDSHKAQMHTQMEAKEKARLDKLVSTGKLTAAQEQLILDKRKELETKRQQDAANFKSMTPAQRKAAMDAQKTDLENWAKQNGIDIKYLIQGMGMGHGFGRWK